MKLAAYLAALVVRLALADPAGRRAVLACVNAERRLVEATR